MARAVPILMNARNKPVALVLVIVLSLGWIPAIPAQTPADSQYGSPTRTPAGNAVDPAKTGLGEQTNQFYDDQETTMSPTIAEPGEQPDKEFVDQGSGFLAIGLALLAALAGLYTALYAVARVRPGLSLLLQRRALVFLSLVGLFLTLTQLLYIRGELLSADADPGTSLTLGYFSAAIAIALCLLTAAYLLRRSELVEVGPLRRSADLDPLTALYNQPFFRRAASRRIAQARLHGIPLSLAMIDVDDFKAYNDRFGHEAGNAVLRRVAGVLRRSVRADDLVARYGGEEFVMLLNSEPSESEAALERIRAQIEFRCSPDNVLHRQVTVSVGLTPFAGGEQTLESLIESADEAMYRAKREGKNRVVATRRAAS